MRKYAEQPKIDFSQENPNTPPPSAEETLKYNPVPDRDKYELNDECSQCGVPTRNGSCPACINKQKKHRSEIESVSGQESSKVIQGDFLRHESEAERKAKIAAIKQHTAEAAKKHRENKHLLKDDARYKNVKEIIDKMVKQNVLRKKDIKPDSET